MFCRKLKVLTAATLLVGLTVLALACGPASPSERGAAAQAETPASAGTPTPTIQPTRTPYPPGYVKPTRLPTRTPFPTLAPDPTLTPTPEGVVPLGDNSGGSAPAPTPTLAEQVTEFARDRREEYDAIARVRVLSHRSVTLPEGIEWPPLQNPSLGRWPWDRAGIQVVEVYRGELPDNYELASPGFRPNTKLEIDQEYILFILKVFVAKDEYTYDGTHVRFLFNEEQLDAVGGRGGTHFGEQVWLVEGETAWRIPLDHVLDTTGSGSDLAAAKAGGESLSVAELKAAIAAAFK